MGDKRLHKLQIGIVATAVVAMAVWAFWSTTWSAREAAKWSSCRGKPLDECRLPEGYEAPTPFGPQPDSKIARTLATRQLRAALPEAPKTWWSSIAYALITVDREGRVVDVKIERDYAAF